MALEDFVLGLMFLAGGIALLCLIYYVLIPAIWWVMNGLSTIFGFLVAVSKFVWAWLTNILTVILVIVAVCAWLAKTEADSRAHVRERERAEIQRKLEEQQKELHRKRRIAEEQMKQRTTQLLAEKERNMKMKQQQEALRREQEEKDRRLAQNEKELKQYKEKEEAQNRECNAKMQQKQKSLPEAQLKGQETGYHKLAQNDQEEFKKCKEQQRNEPRKKPKRAEWWKALRRWLREHVDLDDEEIEECVVLFRKHKITDWNTIQEFSEEELTSQVFDSLGLGMQKRLIRAIRESEWNHDVEMARKPASMQTKRSWRKSVMEDDHQIEPDAQKKRAKRRRCIRQFEREHLPSIAAALPRFQSASTATPPHSEDDAKASSLPSGGAVPTQSDVDCICNRPLYQLLCCEALDKWNISSIRCEECGEVVAGEETVFTCLNRCDPAHPDGYELCAFCGVAS